MITFNIVHGYKHNIHNSLQNNALLQISWLHSWSQDICTCHGLLRLDYRGPYGGVPQHHSSPGQLCDNIKNKIYKTTTLLTVLKGKLLNEFNVKIFNSNSLNLKCFCIPRFQQININLILVDVFYWKWLKRVL